MSKVAKTTQTKSCMTNFSFDIGSKSPENQKNNMYLGTNQENIQSELKLSNQKEQKYSVKRCESALNSNFISNRELILGISIPLSDPKHDPPKIKHHQRETSNDNLFQIKSVKNRDRKSIKTGTSSNINKPSSAVPKNIVISPIYNNCDDLILRSSINQFNLEISNSTNNLLSNNNNTLHKRLLSGYDSDRYKKTNKYFSNTLKKAINENNRNLIQQNFKLYYEIFQKESDDDPLKNDLLYNQNPSIFNTTRVNYSDKLKRNRVETCKNKPISAFYRSNLPLKDNNCNYNYSLSSKNLLSSYSTEKNKIKKSRNVSSAIPQLSNKNNEVINDLHLFCSNDKNYTNYKEKNELYINNFLDKQKGSTFKSIYNSLRDMTPRNNNIEYFKRIKIDLFKGKRVYLKHPEKRIIFGKEAIFAKKKIKYREMVSNLYKNKSDKDNRPKTGISVEKGKDEKNNINLWKYSNKGREGYLFYLQENALENRIVYINNNINEEAKKKKNDLRNAYNPKGNI